MKNIKGIYLGYAENLEPQSRAFEEVGGELIKGSLGEVPSTDSARSLLSPKDGSNDKINKVVSLIEETKAQSLVLQGHGFPLNKEFFEAVGSIDGFKGVACFGHGFDGIDVDSATENEIIVAYEPIWAIGTGLVPTVDEIKEIKNFTCDFVSQSKKISKIFFLYGGSVNSENIFEIFKLSDVNGALIGGSSLKFEEINKILTFG